MLSNTARICAVALAGLTTFPMCAMAEALTVRSFGYPSVNDPGSTEVFRLPGRVDASASLLNYVRSKHPEMREITLYCGASPGPRFVQIDGEFYTLNGKSRRDGAFVDTSGGKKAVQDSTEPPSPLAEDLDAVRMMIDEAEGAC